jgi:branched-chain amino acid transport system ATP-binding protein
MAAAPFLEVSGLSKSFRGLRAVSDVSFTLAEGEIVGLIGPNGAGKTTIFNIIAGVFPADRGSVRLEGRSLDGLRPDQICHAGVGRTFQLVKPFHDLTVEQNVTIGALRATNRVAEARGAATKILHALDLYSKRRQLASGLTLPERKRLEVARALATRPKLLLLDEVMAGLRPTETDQLVATLRELNATLGLTILLIEHVMRGVMALARRIVVLHHGENICEGPPDHVVNDAAVLECYLGEESF